MANRPPPDAVKPTDPTQLKESSTARRPARPRKGAAPAAPAAPMRLSAEARRALIAEAAYLRAERRGFAPGKENEDWLAAEAEVDALLSAGRTPRQ